MYLNVEHIVSFAAAAALIILAVCLVESARAWGRVRGVGDAPAGLLLGLVSVAQMFQPLEPFSGVIIDLRIVPLVLAGAFLNLRAALLAAAMAAAMRLGVGGAGTLAGVAGIGGVVLCGHAWRRVTARQVQRGLLAFAALGLSTCLTLLSALLLPETIMVWFFTVAAPILVVIYLIFVPALALILDRGIGFETNVTRARREALGLHGVRMLSRRALLRHLRLSMAHEPEAPPLPLMHIQLTNGQDRLLGGKVQDTLEAILVQLKAAMPDMQDAAFGDDGALLVPLGAQDFQSAGHLADIAKEASRRIMRARTTLAADRLSARVGFTTLDAVEVGAAPRMIGRGRVAAPKRTQRRAAQSDSRFARADDTDMLFLKAELLMT